MNSLLSLLRGLGLPPALVGAARGIVEAAILGAIGAVIIEVGALDLGSNAWLAPVLVWALRTLEGAADHIDENVRRRRP